MEFPDWVQVKEKHYRWLKKACHEITLQMDNDSRITETIVYLYTYSSDNYLKVGSHDPIFGANYYSNSKKLVIRIDISMN